MLLVRALIVCEQSTIMKMQEEEEIWSCVYCVPCTVYTRCAFILCDFLKEGNKKHSQTLDDSNSLRT